VLNFRFCVHQGKNYFQQEQQILLRFVTFSPTYVILNFVYELEIVLSKLFSILKTVTFDDAPPPH